MRSRSALLALIVAPILGALAQDGTAGSTSPEAAGYSCDASKCNGANCRCASTDIPGGLSPDQTPQFIVFTADDAVQTYTLNSVTNFLGKRKNPNGCAPKMTYFVSLNYTNYGLVTDWYMAGNEIADHTMTHPELGGSAEIDGNRIALNALSGIPFSSIKGFRAPFLNYSADMLTHLSSTGFTYDSSATSSVPVTDSQTDAYWPYTLDNGLANDCLTFTGICKGKPALPGLWEIPMYAIFDDKGAAGVHLMDPWLDSTNPDDSLSWMKNTFTAHYNGKKQPFGLYTHPIHVATGVPGVTDPTSTINMINNFLDWATAQKNTWIVSNEQLLEWVRNPVPADQLNTLKSFQCSTPVVTQKICNGIPANEAGLQAHCPFSDAPFDTCYGCPVYAPTPADPNPSQPAVSGKVRARLPANCSTAFWDPIGASCLCTNTTCAFTDQTGPINGNGTSSPTGNGTSGSGTSTPSSSSSPSGKSGAASPLHDVRAVMGAMALGLVGVAAGVVGTLA